MELYHTGCMKQTRRIIVDDEYLMHKNEPDVKKEAIRGVAEIAQKLANQLKSWDYVVTYNPPVTPRFTARVTGKVKTRSYGNTANVEVIVEPSSLTLFDKKYPYTMRMHVGTEKTYETSGKIDINNYDASKILYMAFAPTAKLTPGEEKRVQNTETRSAALSYLVDYLNRSKLARVAGKLALIAKLGSGESVTVSDFYPEEHMQGFDITLSNMGQYKIKNGPTTGPEGVVRYISERRQERVLKYGTMKPYNL